jgi:predicted DsbA family dithiol-disulfide isomerase
MRVDIVSDTICPWCFIGKRRFERALTEHGVTGIEIGWRPFQLNPTMAPEGMERAAYLKAKFGDANRISGVYDRVREAGEGEGIAFAFDRIRRTPNTVDSHRLIRWGAGAGRQDQVVEALFRRYFLDGGDIGDRGILAEVAAEAGLDQADIRRRLESDADRDAVLAEDNMAREMGVDGVPCFIFERKFAVVGAQEPEVFAQVFARLAGEAEAEAEAGTDGAAARG